ncbi:MAG: mechanosensitive ion channel family protein [Candidatus Bathyarchaeia archaeon]
MINHAFLSGLSTSFLETLCAKKLYPKLPWGKIGAMIEVFGIDLSTIVGVIVILVVAVALERAFTQYLSRFARHAKLERNTANNLILTFRILILAGAVLALSRMGGLQAEWLVSISAIIGAAVGFASQKTLGNFVAGLFLLAARPFRVGDYVRIGTVEGVVQEITINYTKILTINNNIVSVSNLQILDRDITNYAYEESNGIAIYCYTFELGFDYNVDAQKIAQIFNETFQSYVNVLPKSPAFMLTRSTASERVYTIYLYVVHPEDAFKLRPAIAEEVYRRWDMVRNKTQN